MKNESTAPECRARVVELPKSMARESAVEKVPSSGRGCKGGSAWNVLLGATDEFAERNSLISASLSDSNWRE